MHRDRNHDACSLSIRLKLLLAQRSCLARPGETLLGITPSPKHRVLLSAYVLNLWRGPEIVRSMIVTDIRSCLDLGMRNQAADLFIVLRKFLSDYPEARLEQPSSSPTPVGYRRTSRGDLAVVRPLRPSAEPA